MDNKRSVDDAFLCPVILSFAEKDALVEKYAVMEFLRSQLPSSTRIRAMCIPQSAQEVEYAVEYAVEYVYTSVYGEGWILAVASPRNL